MVETANKSLLERLGDFAFGGIDEQSLSPIGKYALAAKRVVYDVMGMAALNFTDTKQRRAQVVGDLTELWSGTEFVITFGDIAATLGCAALSASLTPKIGFKEALTMGLAARMLYGLSLGIIREVAVATGF